MPIKPLTKKPIKRKYKKPIKRHLIGVKFTTKEFNLILRAIKKRGDISLAAFAQEMTMRGMESEK